MFLVDQSGSMIEELRHGENRWEAAHTAITGIVSDPLDDIVRFGVDDVRRLLLKRSRVSRNGAKSSANGVACAPMEVLDEKTE